MQPRRPNCWPIGCCTRPPRLCCSRPAIAASSEWVAKVRLVLVCVDEQVHRVCATQDRARACAAQCPVVSLCNDSAVVGEEAGAGVEGTATAPVDAWTSCDSDSQDEKISISFCSVLFCFMASCCPVDLDVLVLTMPAGQSEVDTHDAPKCANGECFEAGLLRCARCKGVKYCSAACQKVHWKRGGHKQKCVPACPAEQAAVRSEGKGGGAETSACIICLNSDPMPIQSGCACRGDAGLAHVECRAEAAVHRFKDTEGEFDGWWRCATCGQDFTGAMQLTLAQEWLSETHRWPNKREFRLSGAMNLASGKHAEAEIIGREVVPVLELVFGPEHPNTVAATLNLAIALSEQGPEQGKCAEAEALLSEVRTVARRVFGPEHHTTLSSATSLANALFRQGKCAEAEAIYREVLQIQRRSPGPEHLNTLKTMNNLASALGHQGAYAESEVMIREVLRVLLRLLGPKHPESLLTTNNLAVALKAQGKYPEAEILFRETLAIMERVVGPEDPTTLSTASSLAECIRSAKDNPNTAT